MTNTKQQKKTPSKLKIDSVPPIEKKLKEEKAKKEAASLANKNKGKQNKKNSAPKPVILVPKEPVQQSPEEAEEEFVISDRYIITCPDDNDFNNCLKLVNCVQFPRIIFSPSKVRQSAANSEKSPLVLKLFGALNKKEKFNPYRTIAKVSRDGIVGELIISVPESLPEDEEDDNEKEQTSKSDDKPFLIFSLINPRINAVDFGDLSLKRDNFREIIVEVDYDYMKINDEEL